MIELTVKTLDSRNHTFSVPDDFTVKQLKEHIAESVNLSADSQRLIYCGRVLQDDKNLSEYDVNGKVIHLVQRAPPVSNSGGTESNATRTTSNTTRRNQTWRTIFQPGANPGNAMYLGAMAFPADLMDAQGISMPQPRQCLSQSRLAVAQGMLRKASNTLNRLENPTATTSSSSPQESSSDISPDPNANTNVSEEPLASSIALAAQAATAAALAAAVSAAQTSISNLQEPQSEGSGGIEPETISDGGTTGAESDTSRATGQQSAASSEEPRTQNGNSNNNTTAGSRSQTPHTTALADLLDQLTEVNTRLQPFLTQYHQLMRDDPVLQTYNQESQQQLFGSVSEILHYLSHAYHALSDIMCDFSLPPPRYLRCRPVLIQHSAVLQTGIPIQAQINLTSSTSASMTTSGSANSTPVTEAPTASQPAASQATANETTTNTNTQPTPRAQAQQQTSGAQGGRSLNLPSGFELFMDVSPGSITIDSLEATVVTNASAATTDASPINIPWNTTSSTQQPPPEFIQNLMQVLASQIMDGGNRATPATTTSNTTTQSSTSPAQSAVPGQNSQARGNTATHPTTATQTRSTARPHVHLTPAMQSLGASNFDPFLPCNSHHIRSSRRRTSQHRHSVSMSSQTTTPQQTSPSVQAVQINVVQSGRSNASQEPDRSSNRRTVTRSISPFQGLSSFFPIDADIVAVGGIDGPLQEDTVNEVPEGGNLTLSIFTQLIQRITGGAAQPTSTLAEFLETLPDYSYTEGESIFMDLFMTLAQSFTFMDMMNLGMGRSDCLIRARPQLRRLISQRLLRNEPANENSINAVVARFNLELRPYFNILNSTRLREEVDLIASVNLYNTSILPHILEIIMLEEDETEYRCMLLSNCKLYIYDICAILQYCCLDGNSGMENIIRNFVCQMTNGVPATLQEWTVTSSVVNFRNFIGSLDVPLEHIRPFLVYRIGQGGQLATNSQVQEPMEMETEAVIENGITPTDGVIAIDAPITVTQSPERMSDVVWQNTLPADWVPIITRDSQRQRRQNSQPPFSDAYLSGMPSKRRKLITTAKPPANLSHVISDSMASALGSAGMGSGPEVEVVAQRASQDPTIRSAYREQVRSTLRHNLQTNSDFKPEKYPNAAKFFDTAK